MSTLVFVVHNHQPVGNFDWIFEEAMDKAYLPFLKSVLDVPDFRFGLHTSGVLLEWAQKRRPEYLDLISNLLERNQVELLAGGFYEPILPMVPERDAREQIQAFLDFTLQRFGVEPEGIWLAERVWEQRLISTLQRFNLRYTLLDETHFHWAGVLEEPVHGHFLAEHLGSTISVLPICERLRYLIPFAPPKEVARYLTAHHGRMLTYGDDGEKFGLWKGTDKIVYRNRWFARFIETLKKTGFRMALPKEALKMHASRGKVYLPEASYRELTEWALLPEQFERYQRAKKRIGKEGGIFLRGAPFRNFLVKYPEANRMYARMLEVSTLVAKQEETRRRRALRALLKAQCNCAYWHGIFGGLHHPHLRRAVYRHLLEAEESVLEGTIDVRRRDVDIDGKADVRMDGLKMRAFVGGRELEIFELDYLPAKRNLADVLSRRRENYHKRRTVTDPAPRGLAIAYILPADTDPKALASPRYRRTCRVQAESSPQMRFLPAALETSASMRFLRRGLSITAKKLIRLRQRDPRLSVTFIITNPTNQPASFGFAVESSFGLSQRTTLISQRNEVTPTKPTPCSPPLKLCEQDSHLCITMLAEGATGLCYPIRTRVLRLFDPKMRTSPLHQGFCVVFLWNISLEPGEVAVKEVTIGVEEF